MSLLCFMIFFFWRFHTAGPFHGNHITLTRFTAGCSVASLTVISTRYKSICLTLLHKKFWLANTGSSPECKESHVIQQWTFMLVCSPPPIFPQPLSPSSITRLMMSQVASQHWTIWVKKCTSTMVCWFILLQRFANKKVPEILWCKFRCHFSKPSPEI